MSGTRQALAQVAIAVGYSTTEAWRLNKGMLCGISFLFGLTALIPAGQIYLLASITSVSDSRSQLVLMLVLLAVMTGVGRVASPVSTYIAEIFGQRQGLRQQGRFLDAVSRTPPQELAQAEVTAEVQAARNERFALSQYFFDLIAAVSSIISAVGVCAAVLTIDIAAGMWVMAAICPLLVVASWSSRLVDQTWTQLGESQRRSEYAIEQLVSQRTGTELAILGTGFKFADMAQKYLLKYNARFRSMRLKTAIADVLGALVTAGFLAAALLSLVSGEIDGGAIAAGIMGVIAGVTSTSSAGNHLGALVRDAPKVARFHAFLGSAPFDQRQPSRGDVSLVEARNIHVDYGTTKAVAGVTMQVKKGEVIALVGPNGSGKTSLINGILGVVDIADGEVNVDGIDAALMTPSERLSRFAHLSQEFGRYEVSIREALSLGVPDREPRDQEMWTALRRANVGDLVLSWPDGLDTVLGEQWGGIGISGGQWQRIALARVYLRVSPVLILDEPTSAIDAESESQIFAELRASSNERVTILVTHRAWTLRTVDRIYVMDSGKVVEVGSFSELLELRGRFAEMFSEQLQDSRPK